MRHIAIVVAAALVSTSAFAAGVPSTIEQQNAAISSVRVQGGQPSAVHRYKVSPREFATQFNGSYKLTNGSEIELSSRNARYYASMDGTEVELLSVTPNTFVSVDSKLAVSFDKDATRGDDISVRMAR
ncbi:hypothetical protein [Pseudoduganella sp. GCM10020061]|uniref:hypothetical protein n=1 Tax=Pseudoduganella sp. GCM10020061 TaxID=3317345 RepID=UPI0036409095